VKRAENDGTRNWQQATGNGFAVVIAFLVACGGPQNTGSGSGAGTGSAPASHDTRTAIEKRRDAACEQLGARNTACAVADAKRDLDAGKVTKQQFDQDTSPQVRAKLTEKFVEKCEKQHLNSFQVRVYEVCMHEETECDPLLACLQHVNDAPKN
jgi:hypothetical protein